MRCMIARGCTPHEDRNLPAQRLRAAWTPGPARSGWSSGPGPPPTPGLDSLFVGDHHNVPVPYYQNVAILGRLLAEWDTRPAGALFLLPLWHPVLLAEQIGTLASIAARPVHLAVRGRRRRRAVPRVRHRAARASRRASRAVLDVIRRSARAKRCRSTAVAHRAGAHRAGPARAARGLDRRGAPTPRSTARPGSATRSSSDPRRRRAEVARARRDLPRGVRAPRPAGATRIAVRRDVHVGADDADADASPARSSRGATAASTRRAVVTGGVGARGRRLRRASARRAAPTSSCATSPTTRPRCCGRSSGSARYAPGAPEVALRADPLRLALVEPLWIDTPAALAACVDELTGEPRYALDTEFHGERSYWPRLALVQIAWPSGVALVDPLAIDAAPLGELLAGAGCMVAHAADQDLSILERACGCTPRRSCSTRRSRPASSASARRRSRRPSSACSARGSPRATGSPTGRAGRCAPSNASYAAADVEYLLALHDELVDDSRPSDRLAVGARRVRGTPPARPQPARPRDRVVAHQGRAPAPRHGARRRADGRGVARTQRGDARRARRATCSPTSRSPASCTARRATAKTSPGSAASTAGCATRKRSDLLASVARGLALDRVGAAPARARPGRPVARAGGHGARRVARAARVRARPRSRAARDPRRARAAAAGRAEQARRPAGAPISSASRCSACSQARRCSRSATAAGRIELQRPKLRRRSSR